MNVLPLVTCCLLYLLRTRLIKEFCSFSHSSCSCGVPLLQFQKTHFLQEEAARAKERKEVTSSSCGNHPFSSKFYPPPQKLYCNGSSHAGVFFVFVFVFAAPMTRRRFPLQQQQPCKGYLSAVVVPESARKSPRSCPPGQEARGKRQENTGAPKFNPDQCKKVSPRQSRQETLQNKQKMTSKKKQTENLLQKCS